MEGGDDDGLHRGAGGDDRLRVAGDGGDLLDAGGSWIRSLQGRKEETKGETPWSSVNHYGASPMSGSGGGASSCGGGGARPWGGDGARAWGGGDARPCSGASSWGGGDTRPWGCGGARPCGGASSWGGGVARPCGGASSWGVGGARPLGGASSWDGGGMTPFGGWEGSGCRDMSSWNGDGWSNSLTSSAANSLSTVGSPTSWSSWSSGGGGNSSSITREGRHRRHRSDCRWQQRRFPGRERRRGTWWDVRSDRLAVEGIDFAQDTQEGGADEYMFIPDSDDEGFQGIICADDGEFVPETEPHDVATMDEKEGEISNQRAHSTKVDPPSMMDNQDIVKRKMCALYNECMPMNLAGHLQEREYEVMDDFRLELIRMVLLGYVPWSKQKFCAMANFSSVDQRKS